MPTGNTDILTFKYLTNMMERIGFNSELEARKCVSWLNNNYQVPAYIVTAGERDKAKVFVDVSERWAEEVYLNFNEFIVH